MTSTRACFSCRARHRNAFCKPERLLTRTKHLQLTILARMGEPNSCARRRRRSRQAPLHPGFARTYASKTPSAGSKGTDNPAPGVVQAQDTPPETKLRSTGGNRKWACRNSPAVILAAVVAAVLSTASLLALVSTALPPAPLPPVSVSVPVSFPVPAIVFSAIVFPAVIMRLGRGRRSSFVVLAGTGGTTLALGAAILLVIGADRLPHARPFQDGVPSGFFFSRSGNEDGNVVDCL